MDGGHAADQSAGGTTGDDGTSSMSQRTEVPCNGCTACCRGALFLHPESGAYLRPKDDPKEYRYHLAVNPVTGEAAWCLDRKEDGSCVYLGDAGCTIRDRAPTVCREFDCRGLFKMFNRRERKDFVKRGLLSKDVLDAGRQRLDGGQK
jgi:hypothetical protein